MGWVALLMYIHVPMALRRPKRIADKQPQEKRILIFAGNRRVWAGFIIAAHEKVNQ